MEEKYKSQFFVGVRHSFYRYNEFAKRTEHYIDYLKRMFGLDDENLKEKE